MPPSLSEIIRNRRTIHQFIQDRVPPSEDILVAIEHATWAPNHRLTEPWKFYLIGEGTREKICRLNAELTREKRGDQAAGIKLKRWQEIPGWMVLTCNESGDELRAVEDYAACCCAAQNFMLVLWSKGIGSKWTTGAITRDQEFYRIMTIDPEQEKVVGLFWYGYPGDVPQVVRKPLQEVCTELP